MIFFFLTLFPNNPVLKLPLILWNYFPQRIAKTQQVNSTRMMTSLTYRKHLTSQVPGDISPLISSLDVICERLHSDI